MTNSKVIPVVPASTSATTNTRQCGECSLCCKIHGVREISKPRNKWCTHIAKDHHSCTIHDSEGFPKACGEFACLWLKRPDVMPDWLRPDKVHAYFTGTEGGEGVVINVDPGFPMAWNEMPLKGVIAEYHRHRVKLLMMIGEKVMMLRNGHWGRCEITVHLDGRIDAKLQGVDVPKELIDAIINNAPPRVIIPQ